MCSRTICSPNATASKCCGRHSSGCHIAVLDGVRGAFESQQSSGPFESSTAAIRTGCCSGCAYASGRIGGENTDGIASENGGQRSVAKESSNSSSGGLIAATTTATTASSFATYRPPSYAIVANVLVEQQQRHQHDSNFWFGSISRCCCCRCSRRCGWQSQNLCLPGMR